MSAWISPDCAAGKCRACTGDAWDHIADTMTECECACHCTHENLIGDEGPLIWLQGESPKRWRCDACGAVIHTGAHHDPGGMVV